MCTGGDASLTAVGAARVDDRGAVRAWRCLVEARRVHGRDVMRTETTAWLVVSIAAITSGVIAGLQHRVTPGAVLAITALAVTAVTIVARILPQHDSSTGA